jgi:GNAT superfamily N-acetyltransferase
MNLKFRPATLADCDSLSALINSAYRGESSQAGWTTEAHLLDGERTDPVVLAEIINRPESTFLLAFYGDLQDVSQLVGCVHVEKRSEEVCYLGMLSVKPMGQAQGFGKLLVAQAEDFARKVYKSKTMEMTVITARHELLAWYQRRGYRRTGKFTPFPVHPRFGLLKGPSLEFETLERSLS